MTWQLKSIDKPLIVTVTFLLHPTSNYDVFTEMKCDVSSLNVVIIAFHRLRIDRLDHYVMKFTLLVRLIEER